MVVGTAGYMSPEQVRGEAVDARSDIFSFGAVLYEMLAGRPAFTRDTAAETMAAILKEDPPALRAPTCRRRSARIVSRCLEKTREMRFQSARDLAFGLEMVSGYRRDGDAGGCRGAAALALRRWAPVLVVASLLIAAASWLLRGGATPSIDDLLARATFTPFSNFDGSELDAAVSPDGRFVAFLSDRDGPYHLWLKQIGTGAFQDLTPDAADQRDQGPNRSVGFSADGSEIWGHGGNRLRLRPLTGGPARAFLTDNAVNVAWSPDGSQLVYFAFAPGDPMFIADRTGGNARQILVSDPGDHNHFPVWSQDGKWIYYTHAIQAVYEFDIWRIPAAGGTPEQLTNESSDKRYVTPIDANTVLFVAPGPDRTGPWLWALDVKRRAAHRVSVGLGEVSLRRGERGWPPPGRRGGESDRDVVECAGSRSSRRRAGRFSLSDANRTRAGTPIRNRLAVLSVLERTRRRIVAASERQGRGDLEGIGRAARRIAGGVAAGRSGHGRAQAEPQAAVDARVRRWRRPSFVRSGDQCSWYVDVVPRREMDRHRRQRCPGAGLFKVPVDGGDPVRLVKGPADNPVWSPDGNLIVYEGQQTAFAPLQAVRPDGSPVTLPVIRVPSGGGGHFRFLPSGKGLVYLMGPSGDHNFWLLDLDSKKSRQLSRLSSPATINTFDITPDGSRIVFDRVRENADLRLIDLPK